jgi:hypothetical protein
MTKLIWDDTGKKFFETGIDRAVLYPMDENGAYPLGIPWNGLTAVTESPSGAEASPLYGDNMKYLVLISAEGLAITLEAYTYPEEFAECDGSKEIEVDKGGRIFQQSRKKFGLVYRTKLGNDVAGQDLGYKLHLLYGCTASPSEKAYATVNDSPEALTFSWEIATTPTNLTGFQPTSLIVINSTKTTSDGLLALEDELFGDSGSNVANLPFPDEIKTLLSDGKFIFRDRFLNDVAAGSLNGTSATPGHGTRTVTDVEVKIEAARDSLRGLYQPASPVWGESKILSPAVTRVIGRTLVGLVTLMDQLAGFAFGWDTALNTGDPRTVGHGWTNIHSNNTYRGILSAIEPGKQVIMQGNVAQIRSSQYLIAIALNDIGAYTLISTFETDIGDGLALPNGDIIGIPKYPLARVLWSSLTGTTTPLYPYASGYDAPSGGYPPGHIVEDLRVEDVPTWITADFLASFADRCTRANSNTTIGPGWTNATGKVFGILSNKIYCVSGASWEMAWHNSGLVGDGIWQWDITFPADWNGSNYYFGAVIRAVDSNNYIRVHNNGGQSLYLQVWKNGAFDSTIGGGSGGINWVAGQTYRITVLTLGNRYLWAVNGNFIPTAWDAVDNGNNFLTASGFGPFGMDINGTNCRWCNFIATPHTITLPAKLQKGAIPQIWTPGAILASDTFTGTNGTRLNAHTPGVGGAWIEVNGTWTIQSNKATVSGSGALIALQDVGVSDYECSVDITNPSPLGSYIFCGIVVRYSNENNYVYVREADDVVGQPNDHEIEMRKYVAGAETLDSKTTMLVAFPAGGTRTLSIRVKGVLMEVFLDGKPRGCRILPEALGTGTKVGLYRDSTDGGAIFDNWVVKAI